MKYVVVANQIVKISGDINYTGTKYDGTYAADDIVLGDGFLQLEQAFKVTVSC